MSSKSQLTNKELAEAIEMAHSKIGYVTPTDSRHALWLAQLEALLTEQLRRANLK